jgi:hypothetical protein
MPIKISRGRDALLHRVERVVSSVCSGVTSNCNQGHDDFSLLPQCLFDLPDTVICPQHTFSPHGSSHGQARS